MISVVGVRFQEDGKMQYYEIDPSLSPRVGDYVITESAHGVDLGEMIMGINEIAEEQVRDALPHVIRIATPQDIQQATDNRAREREAYRVCQRKIAEHKLEMKLVSVECTFDRSKMMFYFTANGRVDFRALVKDLASTFKTRIELRQIGVRDEARMLGGLGPCGRPICCGAFLNDFQPVSIKMAKEQNLSLNPTKISGVCGRLMCCLKYEQDQYEQTRKKMPRVGREVTTPDGSGIVCDLNIVKETVSVRIPNGDTTEIRTYPLDQISRPERAMQESRPETAPEEAESGDIPQELAELETDREMTLLAEEASPEEKDSPSPSPAKKSPRPRPERNHANRGSSAAGNAEMKSDGDKSAQKPGNPPRGRGQNRDRKEKKPGEQVFGQPVRRENPEREKKNAGSRIPEKKNRPPRKPRENQEPRTDEGINTGIPKAEAAPKAKGWADALEKAMKAADHE